MSQPHATERWDVPFHNGGAGRLGFRGVQLGVVEQLDAALDAPGHGDSKELAVRMAHDAAPELGYLCLVEPVLLVGAEVVEAVREVDGHYRAVVAHQEERAAEALFLPGRGDDALLEEAGGVLDVLRLDLSERHAGVHDETSCFGPGKTSWPC